MTLLPLVGVLLLAVAVTLIAKWLNEVLDSLKE